MKGRAGLRVLVCSALHGSDESEELHRWRKTAVG